MPKRHTQEHEVVLDYKFDRLYACKIARVYETLVPYQGGNIGGHHKAEYDGCEEKRGSKVQYDSFTDQYKGVSITTENQLNKDVDVISGATLSSNAVTKMVKMALLLDMRVTNSG